MKLFKMMITPQIAKIAIKVALVVGSSLNLINQWSAIFGSADIDCYKFALNYLVPYLVASYSAAKSRTDGVDPQA